MNRYATLLTAPGFTKLHENLSKLKKRYEHISEDLRDRTIGRSTLDLKKIERELLEYNLQKLENILAHVRVLKPEHHPRKVKLGTKVVYVLNETVHDVIIVDPIEASPSTGHLASDSPEGLALLGRRIHDSLLLPTATGLKRITIIGLG
jgi:transcription elongation GreA/GreB family factor